MENPYAAPQGEIIHPTSSFTPLTWKQILFSFEGRIPRRQYWAGFGIQMLFGAAGAIIFFTLLWRSTSSLAPLAYVLLAPLGIMLFWIGLAVGIKRWHDRDKSGWWVLIGMIPYIGGIWQLIECGCLRGSEGDNRYGGDPT